MAHKASGIIMFLQLFLLTTSLIVISTARLCINTISKKSECTNNIYRLSNNVIPVHYDIAITLYMKKHDFDGETNITIRILSHTQNITLHSLGLKINQTKTKLIHNNGTIYTPAQHYYVEDTLNLYFSNFLLPGVYTLQFKYIGYFSEGNQGLLKIRNTEREQDTKWSFATQFKRTAARRVFPCWDEPALKATFNISVRHHINHKAFSTMPVREEQFGDANSTSMWSHFETTPLMSTHRVGIVVIDVHRSTDDPHRTINVWCRQSMKLEMMFVQNVVDKIADQLTRYTNMSLKLPKLDIIAVPNYIIASSSTWGILLFNESLISSRENEESESRKVNVAGLIAYEMAQQFFGDVVGPTSWSDMWLNEGFASFLEAYILDQIYEDWRPMDLMVHTLHKCLRTDDNILTHTNQISFHPQNTSEIDSLESFIIVEKAHVLLRMLRYFVTEDVFREGTIVYLHRHQFGSATSDDLWDAMQTVINNSVARNNVNVKEVMDTWTNQASYPLVQVTRNYETNETIISQTHFRQFEMREESKIKSTWWTPVTYTTEINPDFSKTADIHWLKGRDTVKLEIPSSDWIIVNLQQSGYYRVNYDSLNWKKIAAYLNSNEFTRIHVINRAQIIDDAYHFLVKKKLDFSTFLHITSYLSNEVDYVAWFPMFRILSYVCRYFSLPLEEITILKSHMLSILNGLLSNIGYEDDPNDDKITKVMRGIALKWACNLSDSECIRLADLKLQHRMINITELLTISPWEKWIYCNGMKIINGNSWRNIATFYIETRNDEGLELMTCSENPQIVIEYLNLLPIATNTSLITHTQHAHIFNMLIKKYARNDIVLEYVLQKSKEIKPRSISTNMLLKDIILNVYSEEQLNKIENFIVENPEMPECLTTLITMRSNHLNDIIQNFLERFAIKK